MIAAQDIVIEDRTSSVLVEMPEHLREFRSHSIMGRVAWDGYRPSRVQTRDSITNSQLGMWVHSHTKRESTVAGSLELEASFSVVANNLELRRRALYL